MEKKPNLEILYFEGDGVLDFFNSLSNDSTKSELIKLISEEESKAIVVGILTRLSDGTVDKNICYVKKFPPPDSLIAVVGKASPVKELFKAYLDKNIISTDEYDYAVIAIDRLSKTDTNYDNH